MLSSKPPLGRQRVVNQIKRQLAAAAQGDGDSDDNGDDLRYVPPIRPGQERIFSYFAPGLDAGQYIISVQQNITAPHGNGQTKNLQTTQGFEVFGDRFALPANAIHQTYPPQGHADYSNILPHMVFNDAHLPWELAASVADSPANIPKPRNITPWLALLVFTEDEIRLSAQEVASVTQNGLFPDGYPDLTSQQSKTTMTVKVPSRQALAMDIWDPSKTPTPPTTRRIVTPIRDDDDFNPIAPKPDTDPTKLASPATMDIVFIPSDLFNSFVCDYDSNGSRMNPASGIPSLERYKFLAHTRQVNTQHMADAGVDDEQGVFSVIVSHRAPPFGGVQREIITPGGTPSPIKRPDLTLPKSVIVHLVSLQGVEDYVRLPVTEARVGLISLASWTYTCLPLESVNFVDSMRTIGREIPTDAYALRPPPSIVTAMKVQQSNDPAAAAVQRMQERLKDGYTLLRYLTHTGEETAGLFRGAFCPNLPNHPLNTVWPGQANFSSGLQILDQDLGIMDITYSSAWELGRMLAMADKLFTACLSRIRRAAQTTASKASKKVSRGDLFRGKAGVMGNIPDIVEVIHDLVDHMHEGEADPWSKSTSYEPIVPEKTIPEPAVHVNTSQSDFRAHVHATMKNLAGGTSGPNKTAIDQPYNEINIANNSDWAYLLKWVVDKMFLYNVPAHYLISDPSYLPPESIRFFYIDSNWIDALVDGSLSIGNHFDEDSDVVRTAIKAQLNTYFKTPIDSSQHPYHPQIPCYGFFLRSAVVKAFPNLQVHAPFQDPEDPNEKRVQILRNEVIDKDVLLCLLDRLPGANDLSKIAISQPPHQQRFAVGIDFGPGTDKINILKFAFKAVYTEKVSDPAYSDPITERAWKEGKGEVPFDDKTPLAPLNPPNPSWIFDWDNNCMIVPNFAKACQNTLDQLLATGSQFVDPDPTSALLGIQLNDPIKKLVISAPVDPKNKVPSDSSSYYQLSPQLFSSSLKSTAPIPQANNIRTSLLQGQTRKTSAPILQAETRYGKKKATPQPVKRAIPKIPTRRLNAAPIVAAFSSVGFIAGQPFKAGVFGTVVTLPMYPKGHPKDVPIDIVFSLISNTAQNPELTIWNIDVDIPYGTGVGDLFDHYSGSSSKLLSNQRFNVKPVSIDGLTPGDPRKKANGGTLICYLVPRSTAQLCAVKNTTECSFILNQVRLNGVEGQVKVDIFEWYKKTGPGDDSDNWPYTGEGRSTVWFKKVMMTS